MTLKWIREKIAHTRLFSDAQKVALLVQLEDASQEDIRKLGEGIDEFDRTYNTIAETRGKELLERLATVLKDMPAEEKRKNQDAIDQIIAGAAILQPAS